MIKFVLWMSFVFILCIQSSKSCVFGNNETTVSSFSVSVTDDLLTVKVREAALRKVLMLIEEQTGTKFYISGLGEELLNKEFSSLPIEKGLEELLSDFNYVFVYKPNRDDKSLPSIRKIVVISGKEKNRNRGIGNETEPGEKNSFEYLSKAIENEHEDIQFEALYFLGELDDPRGVDLLQDVLRNDEDAHVRASAALALGKAGSAGALDSLLYAMQDKDADVRQCVVEALGEIDGAEAIQALKDSLSDEDEGVRMSASEILKGLQVKRELDM